MTITSRRLTTPADPSAARLGPGDLAALASIGLRTRKLRAGLSALGIAIGVAAVRGLGATTSQRLGIDRVHPGARIWVGPSPAHGMWFYVAGILRPSPASYAPQIDAAVLIGFPAAQKYLHFDGHPSVIYVRT